MNSINPSFYLSTVVLPEQSTEVGDLIQPVPGVLYEDSRLKKGDPRQYQVNTSLYICPICLFSSIH